VFLCPRCKASVRALERDEDGWWCCNRCPTARPLRGRLHVLERRAERVSRPRRLGEPRWRWEARAAQGEAALDTVMAALTGRPPESSA